MSRGLPDFSSMWNHYPTGDSASVKRRIGGKVNYGWVVNTCVIRVSRSFNYSNHPIPRGYPGLNTIGGGDGKRYAYRVREFHQWLKSTYGPATHSVTSASGASGVKGVIMFDVDSWNDATGHFDLWNGSRCAHQEYFAKSSKVLIWEAH